MKVIVCEKCGSTEFQETPEYRMCLFCRTRYQIQNSTVAPESSIAINEDVQRLLRLCRAEPYRARQYASLVLDIDPSNSEAKKYL